MCHFWIGQCQNIILSFPYFTRNFLKFFSQKRRLLEGEPQQPMHPWYAGFKGKIAPDPEKKRYTVSGIWKRIDARTIEITELPVMVWTQDYKEHLLSMINPDPAKKQPAFLLKDMREYHTDTTVHFIIESEEDFPADDVVEKVNF
jgi:DNA topoisomerase-2